MARSSNNYCKLLASRNTYFLLFIAIIAIAINFSQGQSGSGEGKGSGGGVGVGEGVGEGGGDVGNGGEGIRSAKQDDNYGASNIVLPCPGSLVIFHLVKDDVIIFKSSIRSPS